MIPDWHIGVAREICEPARLDRLKMSIDIFDEVNEGCAAGGYGSDEPRRLTNYAALPAAG